MSDTTTHKTNFIRNIIDEDIRNGKNQGKVITRFPPEPNGYLHIGHAKSICLNFGISQDYQLGPCHLRFDDTNPANEEAEFVNAIQEDIKWLGFDWGEHLYYASNYFDQLYALAVKLIQDGHAYVCDLNAEEVRRYRGTLTEKGKDSPYRTRSIAENLDLFDKMKRGEFEEGHCTLRAKINMASGNINLRDPALYRIKKATHPHTNEHWCIYPMYDFAHAASDAIEKITHSLCTLEFQDHRALYNWVVEKCAFENHPQQIEFSRLNLNYTITSKRKLKYLVESKLVSGWDDPRMPTIRGLRRRGVPAKAIRDLCQQVGISKQDSITDVSLFEECIRNNLNQAAIRKNAVLEPLLVEIDDLTPEILNVPNHPQNPDFGRRDITISNKVYIEKSDFMEVLEKGHKKLSLNGRARLLNAYVIECYEVIKDETGNVTALKCRYLPETLGGKKPSDGVKPKAMLHWVDANNALDGEIRIYDRLFNTENPGSFDKLEAALNPDSLQIIQQPKLEKSLESATQEEKFQFNRVGYFCADQCDFNAKEDKYIFNKIVGLRDTWSKG
ncbi:glutamine--tRNA ligase/YqeY domain fusion protein [Fangia hongkongensis]|uniref:glutamine--tRNA ligase/YqeY domain fusion protein n=1 Tax=Fangia hongkongensis TaxID=270495 RepID=UPI000378F85A|nr:glutamine--tRNA ligase/YqeY domain fusion protein [Fangia hongkongensis]MBK2124478.1 glutamine--tRNA ligase/YqeY domain fusion protein [Fangia hongkongensis]